MAVETFTTASGGELPSLGLGLWKLENEKVGPIARRAIELGYRHFDSACDYGNEPAAGAALEQAVTDGLCRREDLWVTSKLWNTYHAPQNVRPAIERTLSDLRLDYLDLYLIHFPISLRFVPFEKRYPPGWFFEPNADEPAMEFDPTPLHETWRAMEELVDAGLAKHIGVCNYGTAMLHDLLNYARVRPDVLQVELHPLLTQERLVRFARERDVTVTGFSPLGAPSYVSSGRAAEDESLLTHGTVKEIAARHSKTPAQVLLRWGVQRGTAVIPKTSSLDRLEENIALFDFELSADQMQRITALNENRRFNDPGAFCEDLFNTFCPIYD
ncbi:2,5-diketo-D-gluconic acid reductase A [Posidoniimonas corsicana]|uniref:2,5-diketo-D-gluconic acid reductase A n=1 Tax=Posidoniimonas corsicana TaxID=1938618 RepID=A0A5C5V7A2_9BACT|nr:aldo/keto reductase [Posidoniimonas corsicana]TWT33615.1 2,5-diketo-D-gluconic acid reductase A [Posidoniimonas corsicana]